MRRRRIIGWTLAVLGVLVLAGAVVGYLFLKSESFRNLALLTIIQDATEATGGRTEIGGLDFQFSTLTAHLYDITLHGTERSTQPPLLHIDKLTVGIKIQSLLRRKVTLSELKIDHPVAHVRVDRQGNNNIPSSPPSTSSSQTNVFDLAARHVLLTDGEVTYNDTTAPFEAEMYGLRTEIDFAALATRYHGTISYDRGRLRYANNTPFQHSLNANFDATPSRFSLNSAVLKVGWSAISLHAQLTDYSNPTIEGGYDIHINTEDFAALSQPVRPTGDVSLVGTIHYQRKSNEPLLRSISASGQLASDRLAIRSSDGRVDVRRLRGSYQILNGTLQAHDLVFDVLDGKVTSDVDIQNLDATPSASVRTTLKGISLRSAQRAVRGWKIKNVELLGRVDGTAEASWRGSISNLRARADVSLVAPANSANPYSANAIPVSGAIHASYDGPRNMIRITETTLRVPSATILAQGEIGSRSNSKSNLQIHGNVSDLHQLAGLIGAVRGGQAPIEITGSASLQAVVQGSMQEPAMAGQVSARNLQVEGSQWSGATVKVQANPSGVVLQDTTLVSAHQGRASLSAHIGLNNWSYLPSSPIAGSLMVQRLSIVDLQHLANLHYPVSGDLSADVSFHGSQLQPAGNGTATIDNARAYGEAFQHLATTFRANKDTLVSTLDVNMPAGSANATLSYTPRNKAYSVRLDARSVILQKLHIVQEKNLGVAGTLKVAANGEGTLDNPQLTATIAVPQLQLRDRSISQIKGDLRVANQRAELTFDSNVGQASIHSHATVNLTGDYKAEATLDTGAVRIGPLLAMYVSKLPQGFQGETELHASLKGPLKDQSRIEAHLTIPTLKANYQALEIGAATPIRVDYSNAVITLQPAEIRGTGTSLRLQGNIPVDESSTPTVSAQGSVDFRIVRILEPDVQSSGSLSLDVHASGSTKNPTVQGQIHLQDVALSTPSSPLGVQNLSGNLDISNSAIQVSGLAGEVGGGHVSLGGTISYRPNLRFNLTMQSQSVRLLYPDGLRTVLDGNLVFSGTKDASTLNGRVLIDSLSFTPDFDLSKFSDQFGGSTVPAEPGLADNIKLSVALQSKGDLSANSSQVSLEGQVNLQLTGTAANPVVIGRTNLTSGELFYRNVRYQLDRGIITFDNPNETEPMMNIAASTTIEQYNLTLTVRGTFDKLLTSYTSDPPLATADIINLIAQGHTTQDQTAASQSTDSILASQVTSQFTGSIQHLAGISSLQIDPLLGGNNSNPSARVAIQQRVTKNFLFTFSTDLSQPGTEIVQGDYQLNKRWSVSLTRDEVGGISVDGKYHTRF
jgi:translocation and assembly module TamB